MVFMTVLHKTNAIRNNSESGFSLIEVAIGLMILGLLMAPIIHTYNLYIQARQISQSQAVVQIVNAAILKFFEKYGHYPTPASPGIAQGSTGFGAAEVSAGICTPTSTTVCTTTTNSLGSAPVLIGDVPFAALGIPFKSTLDGYGNKLTYAVTESLTPPPPPAPAPPTFDDNAGAIEVVDMTGASFYSTTRAHFIIISHGQDGNGAFTLSGVRHAACDTVATAADNENCNNDGRFSNYYDPDARTLAKVRSFAVGSPAHFDDFTFETNTTSYGIWSYIPNTGLQMRATNTGNIYIGNSGNCENRIPTGADPDFPCVPKAKIDVDGAVKAIEVHTERLCDFDEANCINTPAWPAPRENPAGVGWLSPQMLTGARTPANGGPETAFNSGTAGQVGGGLRCYGGRTLKGIRNFDEVCGYNGTSTSDTRTAFIAPTITYNTCPSGYLAKEAVFNFSSGVNSITLTCVLP
jgi:prepilin-type N-terminal cleavage/methylation domain-containing protein